MILQLVNATSDVNLKISRHVSTRYFTLRATLISRDRVKPFEGKRFPTKFHFRGGAPSEALDRAAHLNSHVRVPFETDAENDYFRRDEEPGEFKLSAS